VAENVGSLVSRPSAQRDKTPESILMKYPARWRPGETVDVVYDAANPARADVLSEVTGWPLWFGIWCAVAALSAAIASLPVVLLIRQRRGQRRVTSQGEP
jgi:hypothetical protein